MILMVDSAIDELTPVVGIRKACVAVGVAQADWYRRHRQTPPPPKPVRPRRPQPRALTPDESAEVREVLNSPEHVDEAPATVYAKLLDEGRYLASERTMYRILADHDEVRERRRQATHPAARKPELMADAPNRVWSWDITRLGGAAKWSWFYLYVIIDIFSDRGSPMVVKPVAFMLAELSVTKSHSWPHCSNDNPFSESHFRTLKYRPEFPDRFGSFTHAAQHCETFFDWSTSSTAIPGSGSTPPSTSTTATHKPCARSVRSCSTARTCSTPNASSSDHRPRQRCPKRSGSTNPTRRHQRLTDSRTNLPQEG